MEKVRDTEHGRRFWDSVEESSRRVAKLPYSVCGGSAAREEDEYIAWLEQEVARLQAEKDRAEAQVAERGGPPSPSARRP